MKHKELQDVLSNTGLVVPVFRVREQMTVARHVVPAGALVVWGEPRGESEFLDTGRTFLGPGGIPLRALKPADVDFVGYALAPSNWGQILVEHPFREGSQSLQHWGVPGKKAIAAMKQQEEREQAAALDPSGADGARAQADPGEFVIARGVEVGARDGTVVIERVWMDLDSECCDLVLDLADDGRAHGVALVQDDAFMQGVYRALFDMGYSGAAPGRASMGLQQTLQVTLESSRQLEQWVRERAASARPSTPGDAPRG